MTNLMAKLIDEDTYLMISYHSWINADNISIRCKRQRQNLLRLAKSIWGGGGKVLVIKKKTNLFLLVIT